MKTLSQRDICTPKFIAVLFAIAKTWKQPAHPSLDKWIRTMWYTHTGILFSHTKGNPAFCNNIEDLENIMLGEIRQTNTNTVFSCMQNLKELNS